MLDKQKTKQRVSDGVKAIKGNVKNFVLDLVAAIKEILRKVS